MGKPPPPFRAMPERKRVFPNDIFPYSGESGDRGVSGDSGDSG